MGVFEDHSGDILGGVKHTGSLCNLREKINRVQVDKKAKTFNIADEFVINVLKSHLLAALCSMFNIANREEAIPHEKTDSS